MDEAIGVSLNLGAGKIKWPGWIGVDLNDAADVRADIRKLPHEDGTVDQIAAIHVVEHFYQWEVKDILVEWRRVMKEDGKLILELPCLDKVFRFIQVCMNDGIPLSPIFSFFPLWGDPKYKDPFMTHKWGYSKDMIACALSEVGFREIKVMEPKYHFSERDMRVEAIK